MLLLSALSLEVLAGPEVLVTLDETKAYQEIEGFGASLTDSSAELIRDSLTGLQRTNLFQLLFSPANGIGLSFLRQPMGCSDFRLQDYTYDDLAPGESDYNLTNFSIAYEEGTIIPYLQQIATINTNLKIMGSPWTAPAWMKDGGDLYSGQLKTDAYGAYAAYFRKYVQAYAAKGLTIHFVTLQNEPLYEPHEYAGMYMSSTSQALFARLVGQEFASNGIGTKILCYDHNWDQFPYPISVLNDAGARPYVAGSAFHGYAGDVSAQSLVHEAHTNKDIYFTETSGGGWSTGFSDDLMDDASTLLIGALGNWAKTVFKWNLVLDQDGGPKLGGGCGNCRGLVAINSSTHAVTTNADFYALAHASKFILRGARRIESAESPADGPYTTAFVNPDTSTVVVAYNPSAYGRSYSIRWRGQSFSYSLPSKSVATFTWPNCAGATVDVWITTGTKSKLLQKQSGLVCLRPLTISWKGRTWNVRDTEGNPGNNLWSAGCVALDAEGRLRLEAKTIGTNWYCGQVESADSPGFGTYRWYVAGRPDLLHSNMVGALSTYYDAGRELDIQFTRAYDEGATNLGYAVQPYYLPGHRAAMARTFANPSTTHEFVWNPRTVAYRSWYGHCTQPTNPGDVISEWTYEGTDVPGDTNEHIRMNLWMFSALPPSSSQELVLADFTYQSSTGVFLFDDFEDGSIAPMWQAFGGGSASESGGHLHLTPPDADGASSGERATNELVWGLNGLSQIFRASLATVAVTAARSAGGPDVWAYQAALSGSNGVFDPYAASNAAILRAGYDQSADRITLEFLTKTGQPDSWGTSRYVGTIDNASGFFNGQGLELRFSLVYSNYEVRALYNGSLVSITPVSGSDSGPHDLGGALSDSRYVLGAQNSGDGRGAVSWELVGGSADAELPSTATNPDGGGGTTLVQLGNADPASVWREPIGTKFSKERSQVLYPAADLGAAGTITQIQIRVVQAPGLQFTGYTIRMQLTEASDLTAGSFINTGWATVYMTNMIVPQGFNGWFSFHLRTNFYYDGVRNLLVDFVVNNTTRDDSPRAQCTYTAGSGVKGVYASDNSGDPFTWSGTSGRRYQYSGPNFVDLRLAISNDSPPVLGLNLDFEDGPQGYLTNVPSWSVEGSELSGYIKPSPVQHGVQSLKLWKGPGSADQKLYQFFAAYPTNEYTLSGHLLALSSEPFVGSNAHGALVLEWYGAEGLLAADESAPFTPTNTHNVWETFRVSAVPPANVTSARLVCALFSCDDQNGSLFFDHLALAGTPAPQAGTVPVAHTTWVRDDFNDTAMSNCWQQSVPWWGAVFQESDGLFRVKPGTNGSFESAGYATTQPVLWNNTSCWYVFSATLSTIQLDSTRSGNDLTALLGVCSMPDNPWYVTNSIGLYGFYNLEDDRIIMQLLTKLDAPKAGGMDRFNCTITNLSAYLDGSNHVRISVAVGRGRYDVRFGDASGLPVPYTINWGAPQGEHLLGDALDRAYWYVGAQADNSNRGFVCWNETAVYRDEAPACAVTWAAQTSRDGSGLVTVTGLVGDVNGDPCRLRIEASTDGGSSWFPARMAGVATSTFPATLASTQGWVQVAPVQTTNGSGLARTNALALTWNTKDAAEGLSLDGATFTNTLLRIAADDGDVGGPAATGSLFTVDNEGPSALSAAVLVEGGAAYSMNGGISATWSGFADAGDGVEAYYYALEDRGGSSSGAHTIATMGYVADPVPDATNTLFVWSEDGYGNIGLAASDDILVLSTNGDRDGDGLANGAEPSWGVSPLDPDGDGDEMPDGWEVGHSLDPTNAADASLDDDEDLQDNRFEFYFDTDPTNGGSYLDFTPVRPDSGGDFVVQWNSSTARVYSLYYADAPDAPWAPLAGATNLGGTGQFLSRTGSSEAVTFQLYRLGVRVR